MFEDLSYKAAGIPHGKTRKGRSERWEASNFSARDTDAKFSIMTMTDRRPKHQTQKPGRGFSGPFIYCLA